jgi:glycosyltransferase involved in cell wall biosynthesis
VPFILDFDNMEHVIWERYATLVPPPLRQLVLGEAGRILRYQVRVSLEATAVSCVSSVDAEQLRSRAVLSRIFVIPNSIDVPGQLSPSRQGRHLLFVGSMDWFPNRDGLVWFAERVWPLIRSALPDATMEVVGSGGLPFKNRSGPEGVTLMGALPDLAQAYARASVAVVPLRIGGGSRVKILEAFAHGVPVASTHIGAEGLAVADGEHLLLASEPNALAQRIVDLMSDAALSARIRTRGYELVSASYSLVAVRRAIAELPILGTPA